MYCITPAVVDTTQKEFYGPPYRPPVNPVSSNVDSSKITPDSSRADTSSERELYGPHYTIQTSLDSSKVDSSKVYPVRSDSPQVAIISPDSSKEDTLKVNKKAQSFFDFSTFNLEKLINKVQR